ncbi:MAG: L,D-transpeptidase [Anaerolineales bacterium]|nr:L,D-transpeptidase [Anaerolineales bacterium]
MSISRRDFIKLCALAMSSTAFRPISDWMGGDELPILDPIGIVRVTVREVDIFAVPDIESEPIGVRTRDQLLPIYEDLAKPGSSNVTPRWYRLSDGYIFSAYTQRVDDRHLNPVARYIPEGGQLGEITVPYTRAMRDTFTYGWIPIYRLYYQSVHWVTGIAEGPDRHPWYQITDELLKIEYYVPATHVRLIAAQELTPISPEVPWEHKRVEVVLKDQTLVAYEYDQIVLSTLVSTGIPGLSPPGEPPSHTPAGKFNVIVKMPSKHMGDGQLTSDIHAYDLPGVPWVSFFDRDGYAFHGTYWHHNYGRRMSHGCVNMDPDEAKWLYRWFLPETGADTWEQRGYGTQIIIT